MSTLIELTAQIVSAHASNNQMTSEELFQDLEKVHASLKALESGVVTAPEQPKRLTIKQAFKRNEVLCMICGQAFKALKRHLAKAHDLKPGQYRKQFNIPSSISLTAKSYSEARRQTAIESGLGDNLAKAREVRAAKVKATKAPVPAVKPKAAVPAVKAPKSPVPAKIQETKAAPKPANAPKPTKTPKPVKATKK